MMLVGRIADSVSPRTLFIWGYAVFTAGSLLCGLATSLNIVGNLADREVGMNSEGGDL